MRISSITTNLQNPEPMKKILPLIAVTALFVPALSAQMSSTNSEAEAPPENNQPPPPPEQRGGPMANLTQTEREQLKAAHDKAIQKDPSLEEKMKAAHQSMESARQAMHDAMIAVDPSVEPILKKITPPKWGGEHRNRPDAQTNSGSSGVAPQEKHGQPPGFANLTPAEQVQLKALHEQVKNDPAVVAAHDAVKNATTPEEHRAAKEALHKAMHDAMLKADPSIEPVLAKLHPGGPPQENQPPKQ